MVESGEEVGFLEEGLALTETETGIGLVKETENELRGHFETQVKVEVEVVCETALIGSKCLQRL